MEMRYSEENICSNITFIIIGVDIKNIEWE